MTIACAHRGDSSRFRENTLVAIKSAINSGAQIVEIDVRITRDKQVVVIHDSTLERLWGISEKVSEHDWNFISQLGGGDNRIPLLSEVLPLFLNANSILMIDMEEADPAQLSFEVTINGPLNSDQIYWCGNLNGMKQIRALSKEARIWLPWDELALPTSKDLSELAPEYINLHYSFVNRKRVTEFHELGLKVAIWTVDDEATLRWALSIDVDSITTNQLSLLQALLLEDSTFDLTNNSSAEDIDLDLALIVAKDLGKWAILVARSMDPGTLNIKANPADIVTQVDLLIEIHVREVIAANFPNHNFVGEELGGSFISDKPSWYLDPIDGTTNFANRIPWSSFSLALALDRKPLVAVVIDPWQNSLFEAVSGRGAKLDGHELLIEDDSGAANPLSSRVVSTELAAHEPWPGMLELLENLSKNYCTMRIMGSGTLTLVGIAAQRGIGSIIHKFSPIDHLAAALIVHEAGGAVWDETGTVNLFPESGGLMAATQSVAQPLFQLWRSSTNHHAKN